MTDSRPAHSILGASSMDRWGVCSASVKASGGEGSATSYYAAEGQAAHTLVELCWVGDLNPMNYLEEEIGSDVGPIIVNEEMVEAAEMYLNLCAEVAKDAKFCEAEKQVDVNAIWTATGDTPPADMFGTSDFSCWGGANRRLSIVDFKYGKGVAVDVVKLGGPNSQLMYYALGVLLEIIEGKGTRPLWVDIYVCQPRAEHRDGPIRKVSITVLDLLSWGNDVLRPAAEACFTDNPKYVVGNGCRWCPAKGKCPALRQVAQETARVEFDAIPPQPTELSDAELGAILDKAEIISSFVSGVRAEASGRLDRGGNVTGWKLVQKRGIRKWIDTSVVSGILADKGYKKDKYVDTKLRSPAQIEKLLKKEKEVFEELTDHISKDSTGTTLVRELDPRLAAAKGPASDFDEIAE